MFRKGTLSPALAETRRCRCCPCLAFLCYCLRLTSSWLPSTHYGLLRDELHEHGELLRLVSQSTAVSTAGKALGGGAGRRAQDGEATETRPEVCCWMDGEGTGKRVEGRRR
nr:unnamed protein product [Digitaria exilis]